MSQLATTRMSSRGQVVIPEEMRNALGWHKGSNFLAIQSGDAVILKLIAEPSMEEFDEILSNLRKSAKKAGLKKSDVKKAIAEERRRK